MFFHLFNSHLLSEVFMALSHHLATVSFEFFAAANSFSMTLCASQCGTHT